MLPLTSPPASTATKSTGSRNSFTAMANTASRLTMPRRSSGVSTAAYPVRAWNVSAISRPGNTRRKSTPASRGNTMPADDDILDDLFHGCAFAAFLQVWQLTGQFPPDSEATRRLAYRLYEEALAVKNG